jgi:hypothetical protein
MTVNEWQVSSSVSSVEKMRIKVQLILFQFVFVSSAILETKLLRTVQTEYGLVQGVQKQTVLGRDYFSFQGIPYMKQPLGKLRFKAPEPPEPWSKPLNATIEPPIYPSYNSYKQQLVGQENAAVINVYTPSLYPLCHLPVLVWIHGGFFQVSFEGTFWFLCFLIKYSIGRFRRYRALQSRLFAPKRCRRRFIQLPSWLDGISKLE